MTRIVLGPEFPMKLRPESSQSIEMPTMSEVMGLKISDALHARIDTCCALIGATRPEFVRGANHAE